MGCKVRGNLSERVFLLDLVLVMINILNYEHKVNQGSCSVNYNSVVVKVVETKMLFNVAASQPA